MLQIAVKPGRHLYRGVTSVLRCVRLKVDLPARYGGGFTTPTQRDALHGDTSTVVIATLSITVSRVQAPGGSLYCRPCPRDFGVFYALRSFVQSHLRYTSSFLTTLRVSLKESVNITYSGDILKF